MSAWRILFAVALGACFHSESQVCADGTICPPGTVCVPAGGSCATPDQIAVCAGQPDGKSCTLTGMGTGTCLNGVCTLTCGDGVIGLNEQCDDRNTNPADGCDMCVATEWVSQAIIGDTLATTVGLTNPAGMAVDEAGNIYVADTDNQRIRRVDRATGVITTVAGTRASGHTGDGGPATSATLDHPHGLALDGFGNLYIADTFSHCVRRVDNTTGVITTIAGICGSPGFVNDVPPLVATATNLNLPTDVSVDGLGTIYIADLGNRRIRAIDALGKITTVAGNGTTTAVDNGLATSSGLNAPQGVVASAPGTFYIADTTNHRIRRVSSGVITTVAGTGTSGFSGDTSAATSAQLNAPRGIAVDLSGNLYIADTGNNRIRRVDSGGTITTIVGNGSATFGGDGGPATSASLQSPYSVAVDPLGNVSVNDSLNNRARGIDAQGTISTIAGNGTVSVTGDSDPATSAVLARPVQVDIDAAGNLYIADQANQRIRRIDAVSRVITTIAGNGTFGFSGDGSAAINAQLHNPNGVAVDGAGNVFIADTFNQRIRRVDAGTGAITTIAGNGTSGSTGDGGMATNAQLSLPNGVAVDAQGNVFIADSGNHKIRRVDAAGTITLFAGTGTPGAAGDGGAATSAQLSSPADVAVDAQGNVFIADQANHRIRKVATGTNTITTVAGNGTSGFGGDMGAATSAQLDNPSAVALDGADLIIADTTNQRVRRVTGTTITTIAGSSSGLSGDGAAATSAQLRNPSGVVADGHGAVYVADADNALVRRVDASRITTVAGTIDPESLGTLPRARLTDPRAIVIAPAFTLFAGGSTGTVEADLGAQLSAVAGRYPATTATPTPATGSLARFRASTFGTVVGVAFDAAANRMYFSESSTNVVHVVDTHDPDPLAWTIFDLPIVDFRTPTGLFVDAATLYVADTGNQVVRAIDLGSNASTIVAGRMLTQGFAGDGGDAATALLYQPQAITRCGADLFIADTGNHRVRRVSGTTISTVLGDGDAVSSGDGAPSNGFPVDTPLGLACDAIGNLFVTSRNTVRLVLADANGIDGNGAVQTIYGKPPRADFPASVTRCLTGLAVVDATTIRITDSCTGIVVELTRQPVM